MTKQVWYLLLFITLLFAPLNQTPIIATNINADREAAEAAELAKLREQGVETGTYAVTLTYIEGDTVIEEVVFLTITGKHTNVVDDVAIDAQDIVIDKDAVMTMTDADWIRLADAKAWLISTQESVAITGVNSSQVKAEKGTYLLYFTTIRNVQTDVIVIVEDDAIENHYLTNAQSNAWFDNSYGDNMSFLGISMQVFIYSLSVLFVLIAFLPFVILFVEYVVTGKIVHQIIQILTQQ